VVRGLIGLVILGLIALAPCRPAVAAGGVRVRASVGFDNLYRAGPGWVPVHVLVSDTGNAVLTGEIAVRGNTQASATYTQQLALFPGTTKDALLYLPATGVGNAVSVEYRAGGRSVGQAVAYPEAIPDLDLLIGTMTDSPGAVTWLNGAASPGTHVHTAPLAAASLPAAPEALAGFDAIVVTNADTSRLDSAQVTGLRAYVREGGSLILVGGPDWQATLGGLPADLIPGSPRGLRSISALPGPQLIGSPSLPSGKVGVVPVSPARGVVLLSSGNLPLAVKQPIGNGLVEYLGFDPSLSPFSGWSGLRGFASALIAGATPLSMRRQSLDLADRSTSFLFPGSQPMALGAELANVPAPGLPLLLGILQLLGAALVVLLAVILVVRRVKRRFAPLAIPLAVLLCAGSLAQAVPAFARSQTLVNTLSFVDADGPGPTFPATVYAGLVAPIAGDYHLEYANPALATNLSSLYPGPYWDSGTTVAEDSTSDVDLGRVGMWSARAVAMHTSISLSGTVSTHLRLSRDGIIVGTIYNGTDVALKEPVLIAGHAFRRLPTIAPHATVRVSLEPSLDPLDHDYIPMLTRIYGRPQRVGSGIPAVSPFGNPSDMPSEHSLAQRVRDAVDTLPETNVVSVLGEVALVGWSDTDLAPFTVNGARVQQRSLTMIVKTIPALVPPHGRFQLRTGIVGAQLMAVRSTPAPYACCATTAQPTYFGPGGWATFGFMLPAKHMHFSSLRLHVYAGGGDPSASGYDQVPARAVAVYDWSRHHWTDVTFRNGVTTLANPGRVVSPAGAFLVRLVATGGDLSIMDPHQDLQIEGSGERT
jgi:hypothetical protein